MTATLSPSTLLELEDVNGVPDVGDTPVWRPAVGPGGAAGFVFEPAGAGGGGGGITRLQDADDVDPAALGVGKGLLFDDVSGKFLLVDLATQAELNAHAGAADPHPGYRLESAPIQVADLAFDPATQTELDLEATARANGDNARQLASADLTAIAGLDSATAGMIASDGAGWIKKTYAQVKAALGLAKADVGLGNVDNTSDVNKPVSTAQQAAITAETNARLAADALLIPLAQKAAASGVATLDSGGKIPVGQLPPLAISDTFVVASQAAMLAVAAQTGDVAVRSDLKSTFILRGTDPTVLGDWELLQTPTDLVLSVAGKTGAVNLVEADIANLVADLAAKQTADADLTTIATLDSATAGMMATDGAGWIRKTYAQAKTALGLGNVDNTSDAAKPVSAATQAALDAKQDAVTAGAGLTKTGATLDVGQGSGLVVNANDVALDFGAGVNQVRRGNDGAYTDARTPTAHTHDAADVASGVLAAARVPTLDAIRAPAADVALNAKKLTGVADPAAAQDAATMAYADLKIPKSLLDVKGDLIVATADNTADRLAAGTDFVETLIPDSSQAKGIRYGIRRSSLRPAAALVETYERRNGGVNKAVLVSQKLVLQAIELPSGLLITSITFAVGTTALAGGAHQIFGIYDDNAGSSSGTARALLKGTTDDGATAWAANTPKTLNLTATYTTTRTGLFYLGLLIDATTVPSLIVISVAAVIAQLAPAIGGASNTLRTTLPDPAGAPTGAGEMIYAYVS